MAKIFIMQPYLIIYSIKNLFPSLKNFTRLFTKKIFEIYCSYYSLNTYISQEEISSILTHLRASGLDAIFVPNLLDPQKESLFVFDMDSTLIQQEVIDEIAKECGVYAEVSKITEEAMQGMWNFEESLKKRCAFLKGVDANVFEKIYNNLTLNLGVKEFLTEIRKHSAKIAVFSGGFTPILEKFAQDYKIDEFRANTLEIQNGKLTGNTIGEIIDSNKKEKYLLEVAEKYKISSSQTVAVGDGANDVKMIQRARIGIGFHAKEGLKKQISNFIDKVGLHALLGLFEV